MIVKVTVRHKFSAEIQPADRTLGETGFPDSPTARDGETERDGIRDPVGGHTDKQILISSAFLPPDPEIQGAGSASERFHHRGLVRYGIFEAVPAIRQASQEGHVQ